MATLPSSGTSIRLLSGIPFSSDYKHTRYFDSKTEQINWFLNQTVVHSMDMANFQRIEGYNFIKVNRHIEELWGTNYVMFQNKQYNNKWFYGFVTKLEYLNKAVTKVYFEIDVFQTWLFDMNFKPSYVLREHCKLWNDNGTPVINTVDEGLHYGTDYETVQVKNWLPYGQIYFLVIVSKSLLHGSNAKKITPTLNGSPQPLTYYVHPFKLDGTSPKVTLGGSSFGLTSILDTLKSIYSQDDSVNNVVSLYVTEYIGYNINYDSDSDTIVLDDTTFGGAVISDNDNQNIQTLYVKSMPDYIAMDKTFANKYDGYNTVKESKLLMYPYTVLILDDLKGNRVVLKNEYINGKDIDVTVRGSLGTSNKVSYSIENYLMDSDVDDGYTLNASLEHSVINNNPNDVPILSDYLSAYLQGNRNSIENQKQSIVWNGLLGGVSGAIGGVASGLSGNALGVASAGVGVIQGAGNTALQMQAIQAKQKDIGNTPPSLVKMGSNTQYDFGNNVQGLYIIKRQITSEYRRKLTDYFNMFGYKVNEVKIPNFHTRRYWNYVQTSSCVITGEFNNEDLQELKNVFDNGITLWHTDDIGNYDLDNEVL